ncbi:hypothetical protein GC102_25905 [Paenibacillus sp. LMG 31460]|uniref:Uncharacterized protein n=1 Tax=Paenibacillus germinis TaxID=2654979 RepID=A0ABX1Z7K3_9BACL|nr:hypothetical protein [Paenibacillus germinis]NOU89157.1 hypothetical protein [Paenibacillus germinis]
MLIGVSVLALSILIACYEIPKLWKQGCKKEVGIYCTLMLLGNVMATLKGMNKELPNPADWITFLMVPFTKILLHIGLLKL